MNLRYLLFLVAILGFFSKSNAQYYKDGKFLIGASVGYQYPLGDFGDQAKAGPSFRIAGQLMLNKKISVGVELSYSLLGQDEFWDGDHRGSYDVDYNIGSALLRASYYFDSWDRDFRPYTSLAFGYFSYRNKVDYLAISAGTGNFKSTLKDNKVGLAPNIGFLYNLSDELCFDMNLRYIYIPNLSDEINTYSGLDKLSLPELSIGLFYRF
ncbi:porin family protein [Labilibaculum sp. DW002]|jgi:outer membrane protein W|uniref:Porin family protein n=1 Tax=Paralabilibaculum antarcticum TaxID=2912572 RepID=A0ABT5VSZ9_9BACT|nr:OmpW family outer membrane protein [Labilibaculum sp. DW002]MDE5418548.1 porin family protein [Labilibaculum sp. DW002]